MIPVSTSHCTLATQSFDFFIMPTKVGPLSVPSSWMAKSSDSPPHLTVTFLLSAFQVQCWISPIMVMSAFPPDLRSSITIPLGLLYVPSSLPPHAAFAKLRQINIKAKNTFLQNVRVMRFS